MDCSVARTLAVVGERWSLLVLRDSFYGVRRFEDFQRSLGVARNILTDRLARLVEQGVLERRRYSERPERFEYAPTEKGRDLLPVLLSLMRWGDKWSIEEPPLTITHTTCGHDTEAITVCKHCGEELTLKTVRAHPLPVPVGRAS